MKTYEYSIYKCLDKNSSETLKNLSLDNIGLYEIPKQVYLLNNLETLNLYNNNIKYIDEKIINLKNLKSLSLSGNCFDKFPIEIFKLENLEYLYLDNLNLSDLPKEIGNLKNLKCISLNFNKLKYIPEIILDLKNLEELYLFSNPLIKLPENIGRLNKLNIIILDNTNLTYLPNSFGKLNNIKEVSLMNTTISKLPKEIRKLNKLERLCLTNCSISELPEEIGKLNKLERLCLTNCCISKLPEEIFNLENLIHLEVNKTNLTTLSTKIGKLEKLRYLDISETYIKELPKEIGKLNKLKELIMYDIKLENLPIEIRNHSTAAIMNYFHSLVNEVRLNEAKVLVVGSGGVGKTCLINSLMNFNFKITENEMSTEGIDVRNWSVDINRKSNITINFWDFGGQEIYHATHQFFLTKRSLYIFVWEARKDEDLICFDYWLNIISLLSDNSPVIIVQNKIDIRKKCIDQKTLKGKFKNIIEFKDISVKSNIGINELKNSIKNNIVNLSHIGSVLPKTWIDIRKKLESLDKNYISYSEYKTICSKYKLDNKKMKHLSSYFHDIGVFLHFQDNPILKNIIFINPEWATTAVYKILDTQEIKENYGEFCYDKLEKIWGDYPEEKYIYIIELMKKFEICFQLDNSVKYIIPELLRVSPPDFDWDYSNNLRFEYRYEFMPSGILTRFIVRKHEIIYKNTYWKNGVILEYNGSFALIINNQLKRKISIWIRGINKAELLTIIRHDIYSIHKTFNNISVKEMVPCICEECKNNTEQTFFFDYKIMHKARQKGKKYLMCQNSFEDVPIDELFGGINKEKNVNKMTFNVMGNYYENGGKNMKIEHLEVKENAQVNIADKIDKIVYDEKKENNLNEDQIINEIYSKALHKRTNLIEKFGVLKDNYGENDKDSIGAKIQSFLAENGIPIVQSLSAATIFEIIKNIVG